MKKALFLSCLMSAAVAVGVFLLWPSGEPGLGQAVGPNAPSQVVEPLEAVAVQADIASQEAELDELLSPLPVGLLRSEIERDGAEHRLLVVQVWDRKSGVPAPAAEVFVLDGFAGEELGDPFAQHWSHLAEEEGQSFRADAQGRVELPAVKDWAMVTARLPGSYGFAKVGREHRDVETITLRADETVTVSVVDANGRPAAGVPVGILQGIPERVEVTKLISQLGDLEVRLGKAQAWMRQNPERSEGGESRVRGLQVRFDTATEELAKASDARRLEVSLDGEETLVRTRVERRAQRHTDDQGIAVFRHFQVYRRAKRDWWPDEDVDQFQAALLMPLQQSVTVAFTGRPVPDETVEIRMPATGSMLLRTVDRDGRPFTHPVHAVLSMLGADQHQWSRLNVRKVQNEDAIEFPFVGLGLSFDAQCRLDDEDFKWSAGPFAGPSSSGEAVIVDLVVAPGEGMLFGRLFDEDGAPLAGLAPTFLINSRGGRLEGEEVVCDEDGRFHLPYQVRSQHRSPFDFQVRRNDVRPTMGLVVALPGLPEAFVTDLGNLQVSALGLVAHGYVFDDRGEPIKGATIQLQREREVGRAEVSLQFVDEAFAQTESGDDGSYALFAELDSTRYRMRVTAKEHFPFESVDLRRGQQQDLELLRRSRLVGTALAPEWMPRRGLRAQLVSVADPDNVREDQVHNHEGKTYIYFDWVKPGRYDLTLRIREFPDPFLRIEQLEILPGQMGLHPSLQDLDLSAYLSRFEVLAVDNQGRSVKPRRPLIAKIMRPDGSTGYVGFPWRDGSVDIFSTSPILEVWPQAAGYFAQPAMLTPGRSEVCFLPVPPVEVQLPGMRQLAGENAIQVLLEGLDTEGQPGPVEKWDSASGRIANWQRRGKFSAAMLDENDRALIRVARGGRHRVSLRFGVGQPVRPPRLVLGEVDVRLQPGGPVRRVGLNYEVEAVQQVLAQLAERLQASAAQGGR